MMLFQTFSLLNYLITLTSYRGAFAPKKKDIDVLSEAWLCLTILMYSPNMILLSFNWLMILFDLIKHLN